MGSGSVTTRENWEALRRLALLHLSHERQANPGWRFEDLQRHLNLPSTKLIQEIAEEAGFEQRRKPSKSDENKILRAMLQGILGSDEIARKTKLPRKLVESFLKGAGVPYGAGGYGRFPWPGASSRRDDDALPSAARRRISEKGQLSYQGRVYGLGASYANRVCWIEEAGTRLVVHCAGRATVTLRKRT